MSDSFAPVLTGRRLGVYHVQERIGAGGMGEVYLARDTRLGRDVAIKILPQVFTADPDRLARFDREARVLASLNHPNIGAIYGLEEAAGVRGLVLELVDGETLADRLRRGPIPVAEALSIARQIADALDAAHEKGIVHRDLKPANIKITPDGTVKVLDFGLAKAAAGDGARPDLTDSPTITVAGTREGVILGTAAYMSPEQARGQAVDKRADIWAFGCVLYEMLTGRPAFGRDTITDTLAALVEREPDWSRLPAGVSLNLRRLLQRCVDKDPKRRLRDIADARYEIEAALTDGDAPAGVVMPAPRQRANRWGAVAAAGLLAAGVIGGVLWRDTSSPRSSNPTIGPLLRLTSDSGFTTEPSISADGRLIAYASDRSGDGNLDIWGSAGNRRPRDPAHQRSRRRSRARRLTRREPHRVSIRPDTARRLCRALTGRRRTSHRSWRHGAALFPRRTLDRLLDRPLVGAANHRTGTAHVRRSDRRRGNDACGHHLADGGRSRVVAGRQGLDRLRAASDLG